MRLTTIFPSGVSSSNFSQTVTYTDPQEFKL